MMYEAEKREAKLLFKMSDILEIAAETINDLAIRCESYSNSYDALLNDYECLKEVMESKMENTKEMEK